PAQPEHLPAPERRAGGIESPLALPEANPAAIHRVTHRPLSPGRPHFGVTQGLRALAGEECPDRFGGRPRKEEVRTGHGAVIVLGIRHRRGGRGSAVLAVPP